MKYWHALPLLLGLLCSCGISSSGSKEPTTTFYDAPAIQCEGYSFIIENYTEYLQGSSYSVSWHINFAATNEEGTSVAFVAGDVINTDDSSTSKISSFSSDNKTMSLQYGKTTSLFFLTYLPTSSEKNTYRFEFTLNGNKNWLMLKSMPDELRPKMKIRYEIDGQQVHEAEVLYGKKPDAYEWESDDHIYTCTDWSVKEGCCNVNNQVDVIKEDSVLTGKRESFMTYMTQFDETKCSVHYLRRVPSSHTIVIPHYFEGREVAKIMPGAFAREWPELWKLFIPSSITEIATTMNFDQCKALRDVHFEGTQEQWNQIFSGSFLSNPTMHFNSYI